MILVKMSRKIPLFFEQKPLCSLRVFHRCKSPRFFSLFLDSLREKSYNTVMFKKLYKKLFPDRYYASPAYRREAAARYDRKILKYVTERHESGDIVLCKDAYICVKAGYVFVNSETDSIFKCRDEEVTSGELMSHDGVIFTGFDEILNKERSVICYFKYYR